MGFDAIDAAMYKSKTKVLFLYIKSGVVSVPEMKDRASELKNSLGVDIYPYESIKKIEGFLKVYDRYVNFTYARKLQKKVLEQEEATGEAQPEKSKILAKIPKHLFEEIIQNYLQV